MAANHTESYHDGQAQAPPFDTPERPTESVRLTADPAEIRRALHLLCAPGDLHELRVLHVPAGTLTEPNREITRFGFFTDREKFADAAAAEEAPGIYFTLNPCNPALLKRADHRVRTAGKCTQDPDIIRRGWLLIDADPQRERGVSATDGEKAAAKAVALAVRAWLTASGFLAPVFADSGNGFHLLYRVDLENTTEIRDLVKRFLEVLAVRFDTKGVTPVALDTVVYNASRICKLYGTVARKGPDTPDRPHRLSRLLEIPDPLTVVPRALLEAVAGQPPPTAPAPAPVVSAPARRTSSKRGKRSREELKAELLCRALEQSPDGRNNGGLWLGCQLRDNDFSPEETLAGMLEYRDRCDQSGGEYTVQAVRATHAQVFGRPSREPWSESQTVTLPPRARGADLADAPEGGERPAIIVTGVQHREPVAEALAALLEANTPPRLFQQAGGIVTLRNDEEGPSILPVGEPHLRVRVSEVADCFTATDRPVTPPRDLLQSLLVKLGEFLPPLRGISSIPIVRPDGEILTTEGYDTVTGRYHAPHADLVGLSLSDRPGKEDAAAAVSMLADIVCDVPFETPADFTGWVALLLTLAARPAIGLSPMALISAPVEGSGKGLLAHLACEICTGAPPKLTPLPKVPEEWHKRITTALLKARAYVLLDNIAGLLDSDALAAVLTAEWWSDRELGGNRELTLRNDGVWIATGNNPSLSAELAQRCWRIRILPTSYRPRQRDPQSFRYPDLKEHVRQHRAELLAAVLTIVRAWYLAGKPRATSPTMGSFETWSASIGGMLGYAGLTDFLGNLPQHLEEADQEGNETATFIAALAAEFPDQAFTAGDILQHAKGDVNFRNALPGKLAGLWDKDASFQSACGLWLKKRNETRDPQNRALTRAGKQSRSGSPLWRVLSPVPVLLEVSAGGCRRSQEVAGGFAQHVKTKKDTEEKTPSEAAVRTDVLHVGSKPPATSCTSCDLLQSQSEIHPPSAAGDADPDPAAGYTEVIL